jgi:hypothetical protein
MRANILTQVLSELEQTPTATILASTSSTPGSILANRYFTNEGQDVTGTTSQSSAVYMASFEPVPTSTTVFNDGANTSLIPVTVQIYSVHGGVAGTTPLTTDTLFVSN